ncbi:hypothetical protein RJ640_010038 [Escallonia rubra]|uniref:Phytocyanin domain-containing protein n=1 Tax=Escallonia rubra TaxID=112253 RepID=A0AA88QQC6_9ASTE|nr:hypothetical protein RJ640_010038 [Escallonia rubra]
MACKFSLATAVVVIAAALLHSVAAQKTHVVGDSLGWIVPLGGPIAYETWAAQYTFTVGDTLVFNFATGDQDVAMVTKEAFASCNSTNPIELKTNGPANFTLASGVEYYFIGTMARHCPLGQKLAINVSGPTGSPAPSSTPVPTPPRAPVMYTVGDELGWLVPPGGEIAYESWAYNKDFIVGDSLVFNFTTGEQDVARVTKEAFETCNSTNPIALATTGPATFVLTSGGEYYFISTKARHCPLGQKLAINVTGSSGPAASPAAPPPSTFVPSPPRQAVTYTVGDKLGWVVPPGGPIAYSTWAYDKIFVVGDTLVFNFENGTQDVAVLVSKSAYESCDTSNTTTVLTTSPAKITLTTAGEHFFTSTYSRHCYFGQKLAINVTAGSSATPPSSSAMPPSSTSSSSSGGPVSSPPPESSAMSHAAGAFYLTFLSIIMAVLLNN